MAGMPLPGQPDPNAVLAAVMPTQVARPTLQDVVTAPGEAQQGLASRVGNYLAPLFSAPAAQALQAQRLQNSAPAAGPTQPASGMPVAAGGQSDASTGGASRQAAAVTDPANAASVAPFFQSVIGPGATQARQDLSRDYAAGNVAGVVGDTVRGVGLSAAHMVSEPVVQAGLAVGHAAGYLGDAVSRFAGGLFGTSGTAPAAPTQVASQPVAPAQVAATPAVTPAVGGVPAGATQTAVGPVRGLTPGPRAGVGQYADANGGIHYVATDAFAGQPAATVAAPAVAAGGMPVPASATPAQKTAYEQALGLPAGAQAEMYAHTPFQQRPALLQQFAAGTATAQANGARNIQQGIVAQQYKTAMTPVDGESARDKAIRESNALVKYNEGLQLLSNPAGVTAGMTANMYAGQ